MGWCQEAGGEGVWGHAGIDNMLSFPLEKEEEAERGWHPLIYSFHQCSLPACYMLHMLSHISRDGEE